MDQYNLINLFPLRSLVKVKMSKLVPFSFIHFYWCWIFLLGRPGMDLLVLLLVVAAATTVSASVALANYSDDWYQRNGKKEAEVAYKHSDLLPLDQCCFFLGYNWWEPPEMHQYILYGHMPLPKSWRQNTK